MRDLIAQVLVSRDVALAEELAEEIADAVEAGMAVGRTMEQKRPNRYRITQPGIVEAMQFTGFDDYVAICAWIGASDAPHALSECGLNRPEVILNTPRGRERAYPGDWIVRGVTGVFFIVCGADFDATYEREEEAAK